MACKCSEQQSEEEPSWGVGESRNGRLVAQDGEATNDQATWEGI